MQITRRHLIDKVETSDWNAVYVSADEVSVRHQKDQRKDGGGSKKGKIVEKTVVHVEARGNSFVRTGTDTKESMRTLLVFFIRSELLEGRSLYFFTDDAQSICKAPKRRFLSRSTRSSSIGSV